MAIQYVWFINRVELTTKDKLATVKRFEGLHPKHQHSNLFTLANFPSEPTPHIHLAILFCSRHAYLSSDWS